MDVPYFRFNIWMDANYEEYNCSALGDVDWSSRGISRPYFGLFCIIFGVVTIPPYCVCALAMLPMRDLSIMLYLAGMDILDLIHSAIGFGIMLITGEVYCAHPRFQFVFSFGSMLTFYCSTLCCTLLAMNRFGEMLSIQPIVWLFQGSRTWFVLVICSMPYCFVILFTPPLLFNSDAHMILYDPMITEGRFLYNNIIVFSTVTILPIAALVIYLLMLAGLLHKHGNISKMKKSKALSRATSQILIQSGFIVIIHLTTVVAFEILPFFPTRAVDSMLYVAHFGWMLVHGAPSIIYLAVNQTIREKMLRLLKFKMTTTATVSMQASSTANHQS